MLDSTIATLAQAIRSLVDDKTTSWQEKRRLLGKAMSIEPTDEIAFIEFLSWFDEDEEGGDYKYK